MHFEEKGSKTNTRLEQFAQRMVRNGAFEMFSLKSNSNKEKNELRPYDSSQKTRSKARKSLGDLGTLMLNLGLALLFGASMHDQSNNQVYSLQLPSGVRD